VGVLLFCFFTNKDRLEHCAYKGLNKEQLCKEGKGEIVAHQLQPIGKQCKDIKGMITVGIMRFNFIFPLAIISSFLKGQAILQKEKVNGVPRHRLGAGGAEVAF